MESAAHEFLKKILETPSPSGYERPVQDLVRRYVQPFADKVTTDLHGNVIAVKNPDAKLRVMFAGHCDQIGMLVQHIDAEGYVYVQTIGGWDPQQLVGQRMTVWSTEGPVPGIISRKPIHLLTEEERKQVVKLKDMWLDIGAKDKAEAEKLRAHRRSDHAATRLPADAQQFRQLARNGRQMRPVGVHRSAASAPVPRNSTALYSPFPPCRKKLACAARTPALTASIRKWASPSTSPTPPIARRLRKSKKEMLRWAKARSSIAART